MSYIIVEIILIFLVVFLPIARSNEAKFVVPSDKAELGRWFDSTFGTCSTLKTVTSRPATISSGVGPPKVIRVRAKGGGDFKTITDAVNSIPKNNKRRVIVSIGPGNYTEKIVISKDKPFVTFYGDPAHVPVLVYAGTAAKYGTVDSATLTADADHFMGVNLKVVNSSPRPDGKRVGAQASALRVGGDASVFYNCKLYGYQDTVFDYEGRHLFKDCYIEGTVDFIFGSAKSIYLNSEIHVIPGDRMAIIAAHARSDNSGSTAFIFLHCSVTGKGETAFLGRSWFPYPRVVYAFCDLSDAVKPQGWSNNFHPETNRTVFFGEFHNKGPGSKWNNRAGFAKKLTRKDADPFITLAFIEAGKWLIPPLKL